MQLQTKTANERIREYLPLIETRCLTGLRLEILKLEPEHEAIPNVTPIRVITATIYA